MGTPTLALRRLVGNGTSPIRHPYVWERKSSDVHRPDGLGSAAEPGYRLCSESVRPSRIRIPVDVVDPTASLAEHMSWNALMPDDKMEFIIEFARVRESKSQTD